MFPRGISVRVLNNLVNDLRERGLWAERHSYSIRIMYERVFVASLHLYPGFNEAILKLYGNQEVNNYVYAKVKEIIRRHLPDYRLKIVSIRQLLQLH